MIPHGVKLEQNKGTLLRHGIRAVPAPEGFPVPVSFAPVRREPDTKQILTHAEKAGICDEADGAPLCDKLEELAKRKPDFLVALCFDDDPIAVGEQAFLRESAEKIADGLALAAKVCGATETLIAVPHGETRKTAEHVSGVRIVPADKRYPAEFFLLSGLCQGGKTAALLGGQACAALADAVRDGLPQSETVITVAGDGISACGNYRVRIGIPLEAVLKTAGAVGQAQFVAVGSAMTGRNVLDLTMPITVSTRCILVMKKTPPVRSYPCVRCGRCVRACPVGVVPWLIHRELESSKPEPLLFFHAADCIGCHACDFVCPSCIGLTEEVKRAAALKEGGTPHDTL